MGAISWIKLIIKNSKWRKKNRENFSHLRISTDPNRVSCGKGTYGGIDVLAHNSKYHLYIGSYCSIAPEVLFILESDHNYKSLSTYPFEAKYMGQPEALGKGDINVCDDVWIGARSIILSGVTIGQGAVVAAGSIVSKDVPPYAIVGGIPAKVIKYRFDDATIEKLKEIDYSKMDRAFVEQNMKKLSEPVLDLEDLTWLPRR